MRTLRNLATVALLFAAPIVATRAQQPGPDPAFTFTESMVPMRDGVRLHTVYFVPKNQRVRSPHSLRPHAVRRPGPDFPLSRAYKELADDGYIFAFQDIRGKFKSEGHS